jgi:hypothetical protein
MKYQYIAIPLVVIQVIMVYLNSSMRLSLDFTFASLIIWTIFGIILGMSIGMYFIDD